MEATIDAEIEKRLWVKADDLTRSLPSLKEWADHEPGPATQLTVQWLEDILKEAECTLDEFEAACTRIRLCGYYGPISDEEWLEQDGRDMPRARAVRILNAATDVAFENHEYYNPEVTMADRVCPECNSYVEVREDPVECSRCDWVGMLDETNADVNAAVDGDGVRKEFFNFIIEIYGDLHVV